MAAAVQLTESTEIDHNFSRAHRIVTSSILPIIEQYAEHSNNVWEGSKVWRNDPVQKYLLNGGVVLETILRSQRERLIVRSRGKRGWRGRRSFL